MKIYNELYQRLYEQSNDNSQLMDYETELGFYKAVASGNRNAVEHYINTFHNTKPTLPSKSMRSVLSQNPLQNQKYHFAILMSMLSRSCVEAGLPRDTAYAISDIYILKADGCTSHTGLWELQNSAVDDFVKVMQLRRKEKIYSKQVTKCIDYIHQNLHEKFTLADLATHLQVSPSHLSRLFTKEVGKSYSVYIKEQRIMSASDLLIYTNLSITEISEFFHFASQSHFTASFQQYYNMTPKKYRDKYASKSVGKFTKNKETS